MVEFRVLRCAHCQTFQVLQVTKSPKWKCKLCNDKQSVLKEYGRGTGADCRRHVQKLNTLRMEVDTAAESSRLNSACDETFSSVSNSGQTDNAEQGDGLIGQRKSSHWEAFLENDAKDEIETDTNVMLAAKYESCASLVDDGRSETEIRVTTDWSAFQTERKQAWRNKRKMDNDRPKWKKTARYEDEDQEHSLETNDPYESNFGFYKPRNRFECSWKQDKVAPSKGSHSQINPISNCNISTKSSDKHQAPFPNVSTHFGKQEIGSNQFFSGNSDTKKSVHIQNDFTSSTSASSSTVKANSNVSNATSDSAKVPGKLSKWSTFITEKDDEDDSDDDSDNDSSHQYSVGSSFRLSSTLGSGTHCAAPNATSKWSTFDDDVDLDDSAENEHDNKAFINCKENSFPTENYYYHIENSKSDIVDHPLTYSNNDNSSKAPSKSRRIGSNDSDVKREHYAGHCMSNNVHVTEPVSLQANGRDHKYKPSLFRIGDDDDAWDLDL